LKDGKLKSRALLPCHYVIILYRMCSIRAFVQL
jgi:hypothetical protein